MAQNTYTGADNARTVILDNIHGDIGTLFQNTEANSALLTAAISAVGLEADGSLADDQSRPFGAGAADLIAYLEAVESQVQTNTAALAAVGEQSATSVESGDTPGFLSDKLADSTDIVAEVIGPATARQIRFSLAVSFAASDHNHTGVYAVDGHSHGSEYAASDHDHTGVYSLTTHNHNAAYSDIGHDHTGVYSVEGHNHDAAYSASDHNHSGVYSLTSHNHDSAYSASDHNHDLDYSAKNHNHVGVYAPDSHNHDSLYSALGHNHTGVYSPASHDHDADYSAASHNHTGVYSPLSHNHDAAYEAIGKLHIEDITPVKIVSNATVSSDQTLNVSSLSSGNIAAGAKGYVAAIFGVGPTLNTMIQLGTYPQCYAHCFIAGGAVFGVGVVWATNANGDITMSRSDTFTSVDVYITGVIK